MAQLSSKKALIISLALEREGFPGMFPALYRGPSVERGPREGVSRWIANAELERSIACHGRWGKTILAELEEAPKLHNDCIVFRFKKDARLHEFDEPREIRQHLLEHSGTRPVVVFDLENVGFLRSDGLAGFLGIQRTLALDERTMALINVQPEVAEKIRISGLHRIFHILPDLAAVDDAVRNGRL